MNIKYNINIVVIMLLFLLPSILFPQSNQKELSMDDLFGMSLEDLMNIVVTSVSKKAENVLEAPATVIVITDKQIRQRGYLDLEQLLHDLPGFDISTLSLGWGCFCGLCFFSYQFYGGYFIQCPQP